MGAADERVADLLERWLQSVEMHARYLDLDDAAYAKVQDWPRHQRPTRWVVDLAKARLLELRQQLAERRSKGDEAFAEALELMGFLSNLLGSDNIERFIPLARPRTPKAKSPLATTGPTEETKPAKTPVRARKSAQAGEAPVRHPRRAVAPARRTAPAAEQAAPAARVPDRRTEEVVVADAIRFLIWGREWPTLAGLIARLGNRPPEKEVWEILKRNRGTIESRAIRGDE